MIKMMLKIWHGDPFKEQSKPMDFLKRLNWEEGTEISHITLEPPPLPTSLTRMVYLIQKKKKKEPIPTYYNHPKPVVNLWFLVAVESLCRAWLSATPWTAACQASLSFTISRSLLQHPHSMGVDKCIMTCISKYHDLWYHTVYFHCPKNPLCSTYSSVPPQPLAATDLFTVWWIHFRLSSSPQWHVFQVLPRLFTTLLLISF